MRIGGMPEGKRPGDDRPQLAALKIFKQQSHGLGQLLTLFP